MNTPTPQPNQLSSTLRELVGSVRESRQRVLGMVPAPLASLGAEDEAVHDFRVALRRTRTFLRAVRDTWSSKQIKRCERDLGFFASVTGKLRDDQVLQQTLTALVLPEEVANELGVWLAKRSQQKRSELRSILRVVRDGPSQKEAWRGNKKPLRPLDEALEKLDALVDGAATKGPPLDEIAVDAVRCTMLEVRHAARADMSDVEAMHDLRIREKRLRYTAELFGAVLGEQGRRLMSHATRMQRRLGDLHDVDEAIATVARARSLAVTTRQAILDALVATRTICAAKVEPLLIEARQLDAQLDSSSIQSLPNSSA